MLHQIDDKQYHCEYVAHAAPNWQRDYLLVFRKDQILLRGEQPPRLAEAQAVLAQSGLEAAAEPGIPDENGLQREAGDDTTQSGALQFLFEISGTAFYTLHEAEGAEAPEGFVYTSIQCLRQLQPQWLAFAGMTGYHLAVWYRNHRFCGVCGSTMRPKGDERALRCPHCGHVVYPVIAPAVIVGIVDGERMLLTRYAGRPYTNYALVAGFTEIGETLEDTVRREVFEEVGLRVKKLRYFGSQPWGFSQSVLAGFFAEVEGSTEIHLEENELSEAVWLRREEIPPADVRVSLTATMIEHFRLGKELPEENRNI